MNRRIFMRSLIGAGLLTLTAASLSARQEPNASKPTPNDTPSAMVRIIHASPDAPAVDIVLDGNKALEAVPFKKVSEYLPVTAGKHILRVVATGSDNAVIDTTINLKAGVNYTALAVGRASDKSIKPLILEDVTPTTPKGKARVRVIYAIPDGPPIDLVIPGDATKKGSPKYIAKNLKTGTATAYLTAPSGSYDVEVRPAGMSNVVKKISVTTAPGTAYSVVAFGLVSDSANIEVQPLADKTLSAKKVSKNNDRLKFEPKGRPIQFNARAAKTLTANLGRRRRIWGGNKGSVTEQVPNCRGTTCCARRPRVPAGML